MSIRNRIHTKKNTSAWHWRTSTVYWCIASKLKTPRNLYWMSNMLLWVEIFLFFVCHTMDLLWEKFQWILPLYMKPISFQSKASIVCSVTAATFIEFCLKKLNVFSQHIGKKNKWISEFRRTNPQELTCWPTFCVNYFLRYYLMI